MQTLPISLNITFSSLSPPSNCLHFKGAIQERQDKSFLSLEKFLDIESMSGFSLDKESSTNANFCASFNVCFQVQQKLVASCANFGELNDKRNTSRSNDRKIF
jgi:hypothetical protein